MSRSLSPLRVALLSYHTCPLAAEEGKETGGMNVYVLELAKALASLGMEVDIFTRAQEADNPPEVAITKGVRLFHVPAGPTGNLSKNQMREFVPEFTQTLQQLWQAKALTYQVLHAHYYLSGLVAQHLRQIWQLPQPFPKVVLTYHTMALLKNLVARSESEREDTTRLTAEFTLAKQVDAIITPSEVEAKYVTTLLGAQTQRVMVVPPGVDLNLFQPQDQLQAKQLIGADADHRMVLFAGRIEPLKGVDSLLYALKILKQRRPQLPICLWIVGGDISQPNHLWSAELKRLHELQTILELQTAVRFVGQKHQHELPSYYNAADVVVMPSHYESFGMVAAEALACGVPVLMTNVMGIASRLDESHKKLITTAQHPLLLADQIEQIVTNAQSRNLTAASLRAKVSDLDWHLVAERIAIVYQDIAS